MEVGVEGAGRWVRLVIGALLALSGLVWIGQGLGFIPGSFMTGDITWFWIGLGAVVLGGVLMRAPKA